jgi:hypothetical protein
MKINSEIVSLSKFIMDTPQIMENNFTREYFNLSSNLFNVSSSFFSLSKTQVEYSKTAFKIGILFALLSIAIFFFGKYQISRVRVE